MSLPGRIKRPASPSPTPLKRMKKELPSKFTPTSRISPIVIDDDCSSNIDDPNDPLSSLQEEVDDINLMIKEAEKRHKAKHGERELAEQELTMKHSLEEQAERAEMLRLYDLQKKAQGRLRRQMRDTIHDSRSRPSKIRASVSVQIPTKRVKVEDEPDIEEINRGGTLTLPPRLPRKVSPSGFHSRLSPVSVSTQAPSLPVSASTRPTSRGSNEDQSSTKAVPKRQSGPTKSAKLTPKPKKIAQESSDDDYEWVGREEGDEDYMDLDGPGDVTRQLSLRTSRRGSEDASDDADDSDVVLRPKWRRNLVVEESGESVESEHDADANRVAVAQSNNGGQPRKRRDTGRKKSRKLTYKEAALVPRIQMPAYILGLNNDYHHKLPLPETSVKFSREFLSAFVGGGQQETYVNVSGAKKRKQIYPVDKYCCFCPLYNPQVSPAAGRHGAGLSVGTHDEKPDERGLDENEYRGSSLREIVHYFVKRVPTEWEYCGKYVQGRHYEKLTPEELETHISEEVKEHWAVKITSRQWGYNLLTNTGAARSKEHAMTFTVRQVRDLFDKPDDAPGVKLRFFWQYMECCDYDLDFYNALCKKGMEIGWTTRSDLSKENNFGVNAAMPTASPEGETSTRKMRV